MLTSNPSVHVNRCVYLYVYAYKYIINFKGENKRNNVAM